MNDVSQCNNFNVLQCIKSELWLGIATMGHSTRRTTSRLAGWYTWYFGRPAIVQTMRNWLRRALLQRKEFFTSSIITGEAKTTNVFNSCTRSLTTLIRAPCALDAVALRHWVQRDGMPLLQRPLLHYRLLCSRLLSFTWVRGLETGQRIWMLLCMWDEDHTVSTPSRLGTTFLHQRCSVYHVPSARCSPETARLW